MPRRLNPFLRYYMLYTCVFILPLILLSVFLNQYIIGRIKTQAVQSVLERIDSAHSLFDAQFTEIGNIESSLLYSTNELRPFSVLAAKSRGDRAKLISGKMYDYRSEASLFDELGLYFHEEKRLYTDKSVYTPRLMRAMFLDSTRSTEEVEELLASRSIRMARAGKTMFSQNERILVVYPAGGSSVPLSLVYFIDAAVLRRHMSLIMQESGVDMLLLDDAGAVMFEYAATSALTEEARAALFGAVGDLAAPDERILSLGGERYYVYLRRSAIAGCRYVFLASEREMLAQVRASQMLYMSGVLLLFLVEGAVLYVVLRRIYRPIRQLGSYLDSNVETNHSGDDFDRIQSAIQYLMEQNTRLSTQVDDNYITAKSHLIYQLINGEISGIEEFNRLGSGYSIAVTMPVNRIVTLLPDIPEEKNTTLFRAGVVSAAENNLPEGLCGYGASKVDDKRCILLLSQERDEGFPALLEELLATLRTIYRMGLTAGVSNAVTSAARDYAGAYIQSVAAARYSFVAGRDKILYYGDVVNMRPSVQYPAADIRALRSAVWLGDTAKIDELCERLYALIMQSPDYMDMTRRLCYDVIEIVDGYAYEHAGKVEAEKQYSSDILQLEQFDTARELITFIHAICTQCCRSLGSPKAERGQLVEQVKQYIDVNFLDPNFTVQEAASYFNLSVSNLSHIYKAKTNNTIQNYFIGKKISLAKAMLDEGEPSEEVSKALGYLNTSSFLRTFKRITGTTPGEYRRQRQYSDML